MTDEELITQFESGSVPAAEFHHADHVRVAFAYVSRYPLLQALEKFSAALRCFAASQGKPNLYNETITWAYLFLIHERISRTAERQTWEQFATENPDLLTWKDGVLKRYYAEETLQSDLAKRVFVLPDRRS